MKTFAIIMCNLAIIGGIVVGRIEYQSEKAAPLPDGAAEGAGTAEARKAPRPPKPERASSPRRASRSSEEEILSASDDSPRARKREAFPQPADSVASQASPRDSSVFKDRLEGLQAIFLKQDFPAAEKGARDLAAETLDGPASVHSQAARLAAKARVFGKLLQSMPSQRVQQNSSIQGDSSQTNRKKGSALSDGAEVVLANGSKITGKLVEESADRYVFKIPSGGLFCPPREDVLQVRPTTLQSEPATILGWKTIEERISKLDHPIDIFIDGVARCYGLGLKQEGLQLLEKLLARPDSDSIPLLFVSDADETTVSDWRLAAGRFLSEQEAATGRAALTPSSTGALAAGDAEKSSGPGDESVVRPKIFGLDDDSPPPRPVPASAPDEVSRRDSMEKTRGPQSTARGAATAAPSVDPASLSRAAQLVGEAQALYQSSAGKEGREEDLQKARARLDKALEVLEPLPPGNEEVKKLRRRVAQLLSDVSRASPF